MPRRDHEKGGGAGLSKLDVFCFELSKLFVNSGATDIVLVTLSSTAVERAIAQCTSRWAMARGHRLNTSIVLAAVHGLSGLFRAVSAVEPFTLSPPSHSVPIPNGPTRLCGRKALQLSTPCTDRDRHDPIYIRKKSNNKKFSSEPHNSTQVTNPSTKFFLSTSCLSYECVTFPLLFL